MQTDTGDRVLLLNSVFPCLSETFVYKQYQQLIADGLPVVIISSHRPDEGDVHPHMHSMLASVDYLCDASLSDVVKAHLFGFIKRPMTYLKSVFSVFTLEERVRKSIAQWTGALLIEFRYGRGEARLLAHSHFTYGATAVAMWLKKITDTPYVVTLHGSDLTFDNVPDLTRKLIESDHILCISEFNAQYVNQLCGIQGEKRVTVLPLGVDVDDSLLPQNHRSIQSKLSQAPYTLLNVGRLSDHKAQHLLLYACRQLLDTGYSFRCLIIGEGPTREKLENLITELDLNDCVTLMGARYHDEVLAMYQDADLFVLSSVAEGMPIVLMEAMLSGVPVVAPSLSGIPELFDHGKAGVLVEPNNIESLVQGISSVFNNSQAAKERSIAAMDLISHRFNAQKNAHLMGELLLSLNKKGECK